VTTHKNMSEATMEKVDAEIRRIIDEQYALARRMLEDNRDKVEAMAAALLELETIDADQINDIMEGKPPRPPKQPQVPSPSKPDHNTPDAAPSAPRQPEWKRRRNAPLSSQRLTCWPDVLRCGPLSDSLARPLVMGIVNLTPDSFSGDGLAGDPPGQSRTLTGRSRRAPTCSISAPNRRARARSRPRLKRNCDACCRCWKPWTDCGLPISVDTYKPEVMRAALAARRVDDQ
jgi:hypothetical protein